MAAASGLQASATSNPASLTSPATLPTAPANSPSSFLTSGKTLPQFPTSTSGLSGLVSSLPNLAQQPAWAQALVHPNSKVAPTSSLPNLAAIENPAHAVNGLVYPGYVAQPAPLGVADYGLGVTPYSYNSSYVVGVVTLHAPPNVTQPGAFGVVNPTATGEHLGYVGSFWEFGIQLNTIGVNLTIPGTADQGYVWAQNVVNWNDSALHFVQDTWNFSLDSFAGWQLNSIYSGCGTDTAGVNYDLEVYGGILQCSEANVPITAADYPITLSLYNNFTTNSDNRSQLVYGYNIYEAGSGHDLSGIADTVVFNNTAPSWQHPSAPANKPANTVNPFDPTPTYGLGLGFWQDSEIDIVGGIGGDNAMFRSINGTVNLEYTNTSAGTWKNVPSAYNFGSDTGETAAGIADYWTTSHQLVIDQGPTMLYGLWNAVPSASVHSGDIQVAGTISPSYGFVFISNTAPILNPWTTTAQDNMSWLPTANDGSFNTYLPPLTAPWTTTYYVQAFAAGYAEQNTTLTGGTNSLAITLTAASGSVRAPLDMFTAAQASALAIAIGASSSAPYTFSGLTVNANFTFAHVNDYEFPEFEVVYASGVSNVVVNNTYLGTDSTHSGMSYITDGAPGGSTGILVPAPAVFRNHPYYTSNINIYDGSHDQVTNQVMESIFMGYGSDGLGVTLWHDTDAYVNGSIAVASGWGIWVGDSVGTVIANTTAVDGWGVSEFTNTGTLVIYLLSVDYGKGIETIGGTGSTYNWINATLDSEGFEVGVDFGPFYNGLGYPGSTGLTVDNLNVTKASLGGNLTLSDPTTFNTVQVWDPAGESLGLQLDGDVGVTVNNFISNGTEAIVTWNVTGLHLVNAIVQNAFIAVFENYDTNTVVTTMTVFNCFGGLVTEYPNGFTATGLSSSYSTFAYEIDYATGTVSVNGINSYETSVGFNYDWSSGGAFSNVVTDHMASIAPDSAGVNFLDSTNGTVTGVTATNGSIGARMFYEFSGANGNTISNVVAGFGSTGVLIEKSNGNTVSGVTATDDSVGVFTDPSSGTTISGTTVSDHSIGVEIEGGHNIAISGTTASWASLADYIYEASQVTDTGATVSDSNSTGVVVEGSTFVQVSGTTASSAALGANLWTGFEGLPNAAVVTFGTATTIVSNVMATNFGAAFYDEASTGLQVSNVNGTGGFYAVALNETYDSYFSNIGAYHDWIGFVMLAGYGSSEYNYITGSSFVDSSSYGVAILDGYDNQLTMNNFIGNNGATGTYSAAHIQAWASDYNYFYVWTGDNVYGVGNYWADWHTYGTNGYLAPYIIAGEAWDEFPIGPAETFSVTFNETGLLPAGTMWSVTLGGVTQSSATSLIAFTETMGTYAYSVGSLTGWTATPSTGSVVVTGATYNVPVTFTAIPVPTYAVTLSAGGLATGTSWSATVNGVTQSTTGPSLTWYLPSGLYTYSFNAVSGYNLPSTGATGSVAVGTAPTSLSSSYTATSSPSYVQTDTFNQWLAVAFAIAVIALVIALLALLLRRRREDQPAQPAQAWNPPAESGTTAPAAGSGTWSEGPPPAGGSPPS